jgi:hypothetical protein
MRSLGAMAGGGSQNPVRERSGLAGEVARMEEGFTLARFVTGVGAETSPATSRGGARRRWPRAAQCRRCTGGGGWLGGRRGSRDTRGGVEVVGRRWSQAGGGAPCAPNNGGAPAWLARDR